MERGNGNTVLLTVIGVATLLVALVGATFAYFTASVTNDTSAVEVTTSQVPALAVRSLKSVDTGTIYPGWVGYQAIEVAATGVAGATSKYNLSLTVTATTPETGHMDIKDNVQVAICRVLNGTSALESTLSAATAASGVFGYAAGTATADTNTTPVQYSITGSSVALPSNCTGDNVVLADGTFAAATNSLTALNGSYPLANAKPITIASGETAAYDLYYIIYRFIDSENQNDLMGHSFTVTPAFTALG